ncbi:PLP-dependent transferase [Lentinus tigrinus ALCF2SS1-7]|uniref:PLP-dependent transferase n=1 Tax=Lentinus tigrinus ALCF2SS1-6 TaxID=1328759 RepID=A0A5C2RUL5_9APHY|nr:PLP-dependent transferase [Lentinus tigrinus ALCF2SS1-6]RPD69256.1 PLP-dependent transferase [Lentinus tigrinus ALCF2SS1-7]
MSTPLAAALEKALQGRVRRSVPVTDLHDDIIPCPAADLFSNDYLSLCTDTRLRQAFIDNISKEPLVFGTGGSRLLNGNASAHLEFEDRMKTFFGAPAALLFNSGYDANVAFWHSIPQTGDAVILDELIHASTRDGLMASRARTALYPFSHNSAASLRDTILHVLRAHPAIAAGKATAFIALEGLYSMDGDFAPLPEVVRLVEELLPAGCGHIVVDEAHSTAIYGAQGRGLVAALGLEDRIDTVLHTFGKARALTGAVLLCSPTVRKYIINYGRPFIYSTSISHSMMCALSTSFDYIESSAGEELISSLHHISRTFESKLIAALQYTPSHLLALPARSTPADFPSNVVSPIFPILTSYPIPLARFLRNLGYRTRPLPYPVVPRGQERVRIVMHARNTEEELDELIAHLLAWSLELQEEEKKEKEKEVLLATEEVATSKSEPAKDKALFTISLPGTALRIAVSVRSFV